MNKDIEDKIRKNSRALQRAAAQMNEALNGKEQAVMNRLLAERKEERQTARTDMEVEEVIKSGTPEEKALTILRDYERERNGEKPTLTLKQKKALHFDYEKKEERAFFLNYLKLYSDLSDYADKLIPIYRAYQIEIALLSKQTDKYDAIQKDFVLYGILYNSLGKENSDIKYNLYDNDLTKMKSLAENTPETLLAEFKERHKDDGVSFYAPNGHLELETTNLCEQMEEQGYKCMQKLSFVKAYIEPVEEYLEENGYRDYAPSKLLSPIRDTIEERFSRSIIAPEFHKSLLNDRRNKGEEILIKEMYAAVVPDYREVEPSKIVKDSCIVYIIEHRNEQLPYEY